MALVWTQFLEQPALAAFQMLKRYSDQLGAWAPWRLRALEEVRRSTLPRPPRRRAPRSVGPGMAGRRRRTPRGSSRSSSGMIASTRLGRKRKVLDVRDTCGYAWPQNARRPIPPTPLRSTARRSTACCRCPTRGTTRRRLRSWAGSGRSWSGSVVKTSSRPTSPTSERRTRAGPPSGRSWTPPALLHRARSCAPWTEPGLRATRTPQPVDELNDPSIESSSEFLAEDIEVRLRHALTGDPILQGFDSAACLDSANRG
jgi:hypothetical protein